MNLVLIGPMGAGKTTIGKALARTLHVETVDTDALITEREGLSINELFDSKGQDYFRDVEAQIVNEVAKLKEHIIITGGGVVLRPQNMRRLRRNGTIIFLTASPETLIERLKNETNRPLLNQGNLEDVIREHATERAPFYKTADIIVSTESATPPQVVRRIQTALQKPRIRVCATIAGQNPEKQIRRAMRSGASLIELRLDHIEDVPVESLIAMSSLPVIATDRKSARNVLRAIDAGCDFVDVDVNFKERKSITEKASLNHCKIIASFHDTGKLPKNLSTVLKKLAFGDLKKIAVNTHSIKENHALLNFLYEQPKDTCIILGMGPIGIYTRLLAPLHGSYLTYAFVGEKAAAGQLPIKTMNRMYKELGLK